LALPDTSFPVLVWKLPPNWSCGL